MTEPEYPQSDASAASGPRDDAGSPPSDLDLLLGDFTGFDEDAERRSAAAVPAESPEAERTRPIGADKPAAPRFPASGPTTPAPGSPPVAQLGQPVTAEKGPRTWMLWWIPVVCVPLLGGIAAWLVLRRAHESASRFMLGVGIGLGMLGALLFLRYADVIAGYTAGPRETVIELPAEPTPTQPAR